jgi:hypothetical protein
MKTKPQIDFDCLRQIHVLHKTEEDKNMSWEFLRLLSIAKKKEITTAQIVSVW